MAQDQPACSVEQRLQTACEAGEYHQAWEHLVQAYTQTVWTYCVNMLKGDTEHANDMTHDIFEAAYKALPKFRRQSSSKTWLWSIAHNTCCRAQTTRRRQADLLTRYANAVPGPQPLPAPEEVLNTQDELRQLRWALAQLPPQQRSIIVMHYGIDLPQVLSVAEVAGILGRSQISVHRDIKQGLQQLKELLTHATR